ncbi:MAG: hypothetical protein GC138_04055 [Gammaproteobacteria bacterium]|nr:hypothetical protein [Gammaproteobacteria bacterium]
MMFDDDDFVFLPQNAIELELDVFSHHLDLALAAGAGLVPAPDPRKKKVYLLDEDGKELEITFTDRPENRAILAVKESLKDTRQFSSFMWRFWALMDLIREDKLRPRCPRPTDDDNDDDEFIIPARVLDVARRMRLNKRGAFNVSNFRRLVARSNL